MKELQTLDEVQDWCLDALTQATVHETDPNLRLSFAASLGELVLTMEFGIELNADN